MTRLHLSLPLKVVVLACIVCVTSALAVTTQETVTTHETYAYYHPAYLDLPADKPMIGRPILYGCGPGMDQAHYWIDLPTYNRSPYDLDIRIKVLGDNSELSWTLSGCRQASGGFCGYAIGRVSRQRKKPVYVHLDWRRGPKSGTETYTILPQEDNTVPQPAAPPALTAGTAGM